ncbi:MAG: hypothetical protein ACI8PT_003119 [Gammaproteobacteria bacterium]|jgi:hypothetical protein
MSQYRLLSQRRFGSFFLTQFLGAFNDNLFKSALLIYIAFTLTDSGTIVNAAQALFILPYFIFSSLSGQLADKVNKSRLIRQIKIAENGIMILGTFAFVSGETYTLLGIMFLMAMSRPLRLLRLFRSPVTLRVGAPISAGEFSAPGLESRVRALHGQQT